MFATRKLVRKRVFATLRAMSIHRTSIAAYRGRGAWPWRKPTSLRSWSHGPVPCPRARRRATS